MNIKRKTKHTQDVTDAVLRIAQKKGLQAVHQLDLFNYDLTAFAAACYLQGIVDMGTAIHNNPKLAFPDGLPLDPIDFQI